MHIFSDCRSASHQDLTATDKIQYIYSPGYPKYRNSESFTWKISPMTKTIPENNISKPPKPEILGKCIQLEFLDLNIKRFDCTLNENPDHPDPDFFSGCRYIFCKLVEMAMHVIFS